MASTSTLLLSTDSEPVRACAVSPQMSFQTRWYHQDKQDIVPIGDQLRPSPLTSETLLGHCTGQRAWPWIGINLFLSQMQFWVCHIISFLFANTHLLSPLCRTIGRPQVYPMSHLSAGEDRHLYKSIHSPFGSQQITWLTRPPWLPTQ